MSAAAAASDPLATSPVRHALGRLWVYVARNRQYYAVWSLLTLAYVAGFVAFPILVGWAVRAIEQGLPAAVVMERSLWLVAVVIARAGLRYFSRTLVFYAAREIEYEIRNDLFAHLQRLPQSFFARWRTGDLMSRCVNDLNSVRLLLGPGLLTVVQTPILYLGVIAAMFVLNPLLTLLVLIPYPAFILIARAFGRSLYKTNLGVQEGLAELSNQLQEAVSGVAVVKAYAMEDVTAQRFDEVNETLFRRHLRLVRVTGAMPAITSLLPAAAMWMVLVVGGRQIAHGQMAVSEFITFAVYIYELTFPTFIMGWVFALLQRGAAAMQRIDEVLSTDPTIADPTDVEDVRELRGEIEFRGLTFRYSGSSAQPALEDVTLHVPPGSTLGVVGRVGSGKSTLASLLPRLFEVEDGQLFLDGIDVNRIPLRTLREHIAMVPQDSFLFSMSLADNIAYGLREPNRDAVVQAAERAQLAKDVAELPGGYDTLVGERGVMLSGGQRQRAALARALAVRPRILILDDALSSVDAETEAAIQNELEEVFAGRTVVVVAHRVSTVRGADQIIVLDDGRIVERGSHAELVRGNGLYARMAREQELEDQLAAVGEVA